jgi:putative endonuclease
MTARQGKPALRRSGNARLKTRSGQATRTKRWLVYLARCSDETLYCGVTNDLKNRIAAHNSADGAKYTRSRRPVVVVWSKRCSSKSKALKMEHAVKRLTRAQKMRLVAGG